ncbi:hypothetical protein F4825DRAFT_476499 [Nemania diffusa]|nr:hypothetical protein F4825DRAFT_476499 [Nemania diffusa]
MSPFRAIVLGAGPAGLFAAHALAAAGIDFIVLERQPEIVRYRGALLVAWPPLVRLMDQLGLYKPMLEFSTRLLTKTNLTHTGEPLCSARVFGDIEDELGYPSLGISRGNFLRVLYDNLPHHETKVKANAHAVKVETHKDGVHVYLADGSMVDGSVVIAADGVHSPVRKLIQDLGASGDSAPSSPMIPGYLSLFGHTRCVREDIALADFAESHGPGVASQCIRLNDTMFFSVLKRLAKPTMEKQRFTSEDLEKFSEEMSDIAVFPGVQLKEIWPLREETNATLLQQEEGMAEKWYHGRLVLVGDAAHKMTSVNGQGALCAALSVVVLVNNLYATLQKNSSPSTEDLEATFAKYEFMRRPVATGAVNFGAMITRSITWTAKGDEASDRARTSATMAAEAKKIILPGLSHSPVFDFIPFEGKCGTTPWMVDAKFLAANAA